MTERRKRGVLEHEVLSALWTLGEPATPGIVLKTLSTELAYTTVMTILTRLWHKGLVTREERGRAYAYCPAFSEAELTAKRMRAALAAAPDRKGALSRFVGSLSAHEARTLRTLLESDGRTRKI